ncbi:MAG: ChaN family lipoprotein [Bacteroidales bacterium]|nr:ChaN family lipoprotein [Bacteroidales bacterium]MCF8391017.1 ChaN family lipoprotein [Bacteroidales bacterium]
MNKLNAFLILIAGLLTGAIAEAQKSPEAYELYDSQGKQVNWTKAIKKLSSADIVLFGELHNDPIAHWMQLQLLNDLLALDSTNLILGAEMFETDQQLIIDEYLDDYFDDKRFEEGTNLWKNYSTDYKPILTTAKERNVSFVATNIPRRYANMVSKGGFESLETLSEEAKLLISPLPVLYDSMVPAYKKILEMDVGPVKNKENFPKAQAVKDATMAFSILKYWEEGKLFLHFNGAYHSDFHDGIVWYLLQSNSGLKIMTLSTVLQEDTSKLDEENLNRADFIIVVPADMTRTY